MRVAVYTDYAYHERDGEILAERAFVLFLAAVAERVERMVVLGRLDPADRRGRYAVDPARTDFVALPYYRSLARPFEALRALFASSRTLWRVLGDVDAIWLLGPHPFMPLFALLARLRRRRVILGVRQDFPAYIASRHPGNRPFRLAARLLEGSFRLMARRFPTVAVGPQIAEHYSGARAVLEIAVSLVHEREIAGPEALARRDYAEPSLTALSVGRLETEKNPLLMVDALAELREHDPRWRLLIHGEGPLETALAEHASERGVSDAIELGGYLAVDQGLMEVYRRSHALLHVSYTEGLPQVLLEACAAALPVVATDVGGIGDAIGNAAVLIAPSDAGAAARALARIGDEPELRAELVREGTEWVRERTIEAEAQRVARFLEWGGT